MTERRAPSSEEDIAAYTVGQPTRVDGQIELVEADPAWPDEFAAEADRVRRVLGDRVRSIDHVGSTAVPGLAAKPIIDLVLAVADSAAEDEYVPPLQAAGYVLRVREPGWHEHRLFKGPDRDINLHVFTDGDSEIRRMLMFRDILRSDSGALATYRETKIELASRTWRYVQEYADAKNDVIDTILTKAGWTG